MSIQKTDKVNLKILYSFFGWRISLFIISALSIFLISIFGDRFPYKETLINSNLPYWIWQFGNFDGVHYLGIAAHGYAAQFTQAFFPLYPLLIHALTFNSNYLLVGLLISNILFAISLFLLYKLFRIDYDSKVSLLSLVLLLVFPTSFYFGSVYTESFFLCLSVACIYFARKRNFLLSGIFAALSGATRIIGLALIPLILIEIFYSHKEKSFQTPDYLKSILGLIISPLGVLLYMIYLKITYNNPFYFLSAQPSFGASRSSVPLVLLPQVLFRYFKIFITTPINSYPYFNAVLEFAFTILALGLLIVLFKKVRLSYWVFILISILVPTMTGTLSSMPRYVLMIYPLLPALMIFLSRYLKLWIILSIILQILLATLFLRGYWIA